jgi:TetR/AcrR family transcriptional regulator, upper aerobic nicotinate degradation pathway regulator
VNQPIPRPTSSRAQDTRASLLQAAVSVFAESGLHGGSVSRIARLAKSHDRMIYYYFGSKEGLFIATLEEIYQSQYNEAEAAVELDLETHLGAQGSRAIFFVRYFRDHPDL